VRGIPARWSSLVPNYPIIFDEPEDTWEPEQRTKKRRVRQLRAKGFALMSLSEKNELLDLLMDLVGRE